MKQIGPNTNPEWENLSIFMAYIHFHGFFISSLPHILHSHKSLNRNFSPQRFPLKFKSLEMFGALFVSDASSIIHELILKSRCDFKFSLRVLKVKKLWVKLWMSHQKVFLASSQAFYFWFARHKFLH